MKITVSREIADFAGIWPVLDQPGDHFAYAFQARDVLEVWLQTIGAARQTRPVFVSVSEPEGTPVMLLPLGIERQHGLRILRFLDGGVSDYNAPVLFPGANAIEPDAMNRLWAEIAGQLPRFDVAVLEKIPADVTGMRNPMLALTPAADFSSGHLIRLNAKAEGAKTAAKQFRFSDGPRKRRKLDALAVTRNFIATEPADIARVMAEFIRQKSRRYVETRGADGFDRPGYREYYHLMVERFCASGHVQLSAFLSGETPIATHLGIVTRDRFYFLMPAHEGGAWAKLSPGLLHMEEIIAWSLANGIGTFDMGVGDEGYKSRIENDQLPLFRGQYSRTAAGSIYILLSAARRRLAAGPLGRAVRARRKSQAGKTGRSGTEQEPSD